MKMKKLMVVAFSVLTGFALAQDAVSEAKKAPCAVDGEKAVKALEKTIETATKPKVAEKLGISNEAKQSIKKINDDCRKAVKELQEKAKVVMAKQADLLQQPSIDEAAVMSVIDEHSEIRKEMAKAEVRRLIALKSMFTIEQLDKAAEINAAQKAEMAAQKAEKEKAKDKAKTPAAK